MFKMLIIRNNNGNIQYSYQDKPRDNSKLIIQSILPLSPPKVKDNSILSRKLWYNLHRQKINEIIDIYINKLTNIDTHSSCTYNVVFNENVFTENMISILHRTSDSRKKDFVI
jgi:hypothetical protein